MLRREGEGVVLCGKGKCCPVISKVDEETYAVTDDNGNTIHIKKEQLELIPDAVKAISGEQVLLKG